MGGCVSKAPSEEPFGLGKKDDERWKSKLSIRDARHIFEQDGTVPINCSNELLEFRVHLSEPMLLRSFGKYASEKDMLQMLLCWGDIMEFRSMRPDHFKIEKAQLILQRFTQETSEYKLPNGSVPREMLDTINAAVIEANVKLVESGEAVIPSALFDGMLYITLNLMFEHLFTPYKKSEAYETCLFAMKSAYNRVTPDDFVFMEELGRGGFASVVRCRKKSTGVHYAMKIQTKANLLKIFPEFPSRVTVELEALASCDNPFIVSLDYAFQTSGLVMLAMEIGPAGTLADALGLYPNIQMPEERVVFYSAQIVLGLSHLHKLGLIYRDLKPSNVLLCADGYVKLADLGGVVDVGGKVLGERFTERDTSVFSSNNALTKEENFLSLVSGANSTTASAAFKLGNLVVNGQQISASSACSTGHKHDSSISPENSAGASITDVAGRLRRDSASLKRAKSIMGTGGFMAPEMLVQIFNQDHSNTSGYTNMIDFWCLGVTMYKLLCGRLPFSEEQIASLVSYLRVSVERRATDMPDLVNDYSAFLQDALVNRPDLMTADTGRFLVDLFQVDYHERIGHGPDGLNNIKHHPCFKNIDWKRLARRNVLPPFIPQEVKPALESMVEHESFFDCLAYIKHTSWDIQAPPPEKDRYFASWSFVSAIALETEIELERQSCSNGKLLMVETDGAQHGISQISSQTATHNDYHSNSIDDIVTRIKSLISSTGAPITPMSPITSGKKYNSESEMMVSIERKCVPNK